jgi:hypothetical protein
MAFKPNYQQERGNRNRAKEQKKQEKLRRREETTMRRKGADDAPDSSEPVAESTPSDPRPE